METKRKSMKKMFPNLIRELEGGENKVRIDSIRANAAKAEETLGSSEEPLLAEAENAIADKFRHYSPTVIDFIRRCDNSIQAEEIISYMQQRGELTEEYACEIREQLRKQGVRSFGSKKDADFYFKESGLC
jgi:hypothetical protein